MAESCSVKECSGNLTDYRLGLGLCYVGICSDVAACTGSLAILLLYLTWKDLRRTGAQQIITYLAIADLCTALVRMAEDCLIIWTTNNNNDATSCEDQFKTICQIIIFLSLCSILASFLWTAILAFYFYLSVSGRSRLAAQMVPLYHVLAWGFPVVVALVFLCTDTLAYAPFVTAMWCLLGDPTIFYHKPFVGSSTGVHVAIKAPEMLGFVFILVMYIATVVSIWRKNVRLPGQKFHAVQMRLICIPVFFILLRVWNIVQYFYSTRVAEQASQPPLGCVPPSMKQIHFAIGVPQAFDGGQGWVNAILYILLSREMRKKMALTLTCRSKNRRARSSQTTVGVSSPDHFSTQSNTYYSSPVSNASSQQI